MFVGMIFDALITPLIEILARRPAAPTPHDTSRSGASPPATHTVGPMSGQIYILVLLLIRTCATGAIDRMTYFQSWCMPIARELAEEATVHPA